VAQITVAIVSWNTRDLLRVCLASLPPGPEVWVVDNGSSDGSVAMVRTEYPNARLVTSERNLGFGGAINLVAARSGASELLLCANADVALRPGALEALTAALERDPGAAAAAPRLVLPDGAVQHSAFAFPTVPATALFVLGLAGDRLCTPGRWDMTRARRVPWAIGACLLVRRSAYEAVGGFDERQWMYAEDLDLGWRLRRAGWATRYEPRAVVDHVSSASTAQAFGDTRVERWQRATYAWVLRRRGALALRVVAALHVAGAAARGEWRWALLHARTGLLASRRSLSEQK
jgi:N-acetylglucosaminyl-diphospho-decaprenol L-rhamnosyltransferase